jgi:NAD(P)-dependent dehydrogenase (short-subunit alcohol dehydrogenase family)
MYPLQGKVAIVTGAGRMRNIGRGVALALARAGADVVITGTGRDPATFPEAEQRAGWRDIESVAEEIRATGRRALPVVVDVRRPDQVEAMVERTVRELGRVDILVNNAAAARGADRVPAVELPDDQWLAVLDVKLDGAFFCSRAVARRLIAQGEGGHIVNISSTAGKRGFVNMAAYAVANAGLQMLGASLARELGRHSITVNSLCIGYTDTSRNDYMGRGETYYQQIEALVPLNRAATPEEIAGVVLFLCTPAGGYITGQSINVDGGMNIH